MSLFLPKEMVIRDGNLLRVKPTITTFDPGHHCKRDGKCDIFHGVFRRKESIV